MASTADILDAKPEAEAPDAKANPFLTGIHAPMTEEVTVEDLKVTGTIPAALDGRYLRIGPNPAGPVDPARHHWFTGDGMVHGLRLEGGKALWYRNRWIRSNRVGEALGVAPAPGPRRALGDTVNTNVLGFAGHVYAMVEAGSTPVLLGETLESLTYSDFEGTLKGSFSAHPHLDPATGELHAICYEGMDPTRVRHVVVAPDGRVSREEPVRVADGPSIHDCAITGRYVLVLDLPVTFSMEAAMAGRGFPYRWNPAHPARVGLLPRDGTQDDIIWCAVEPCYVFHVANAFDRADGTVVLDVVAHETMFAESEAGPDSKASAFERWTIDPEAKRVVRTVIDRDPQEFPRPDERRFGRPYRYAYCMALPVREEFVGATRLYKHDLETGTRQVHEFGPNRFPGEFVFVPAHADAAEDEGWLIGLVIDMNDETTELAILDARNFAGAPQALVKIPHRVPPGFHGNWVARG
jgi:8'-apo-carotenoid 13,14-cleaving dioxygenase